MYDKWEEKREELLCDAKHLIVFWLSFIHNKGRRKAGAL